MAFCVNCGSQFEGPYCSKCGAAAPGSPAAPAGQPPAKKSKVLVYVLAGCGGLVVLVLIAVLAGVFYFKQRVQEMGGNPAFAAAKIAISMNPAVEIVGQDAEAGTITLREKKTGKTVTLDFRDIQKGRISFEDADGKKVNIQGGEGSLAGVPAWVPRYPGAQAAGTFSSQGAKENAGTFQLNCGGSIQEVADFYEREMKAAGMTINRHSMSMGGGDAVMVMGENKSDGRILNATVSSSEGATTAQIVYQAKK
jgi:hypothetical protein